LKIISVEQGSESWLEYRRSRIMATDASAILGLSPWVNTFDLWQQKLQMVAPTIVNDKMRRGSELEPIAREEFNNKFLRNMIPMVVESSEHFWAAASLDGYCNDTNEILEIKCPGYDTHQLAIQGEIRPYYMAQMQHQIFVTRANQCMYWSYNPDMSEKFVMIEVLPDYEYIEKMIEIEKKFYFENMQEMVAPEKIKPFRTKFRELKEQ
jgi:putative phage-type endonuclease